MDYGQAIEGKTLVLAPSRGWGDRRSFKGAPSPKENRWSRASDFLFSPETELEFGV